MVNLKLGMIRTVALFLYVMVGSVWCRAAMAESGYSVSVLATGLHSPWTAVALPDGRWLITERDGNLVQLSASGELTRTPIPLTDLYVAGQGGLMDIALSQEFAQTGTVLLTFAQGSGTANHLAVAKAQFDGQQLTTPEVIFSVSPDKATPVHYGGRLAQLADGTWLVTSGEGFDYREQAQRLTSQLGKVLHFNADGTVPAVQPFEDAPFVYTIGHRNPQGLVVDSQSQQIYLLEHGPAGGDEVNLLVAGSNYGWPVVTNGLDYSGARISPFTHYPGMTEPVFDWTPSVAPSGMILYRGAAFPWLQNQLIVTTLKNKSLYRLDLATSPIQSEKIFATIDERLRDVAVDSHGNLIVLTDGENARLLKISPAD